MPSAATARAWVHYGCGQSSYQALSQLRLSDVDIIVHVVGGSSAPAGGFAVLAFFVSPQAASITGTEYVIDGGSVPTA